MKQAVFRACALCLFVSLGAQVLDENRYLSALRLVIGFEITMTALSAAEKLRSIFQ